MFKTLFKPVFIGSLTVPNHIVRSTTYNGASDKLGRVTDSQVRLFEDQARGGLGLIISGIANAHGSVRISAFQLDLSTDKCFASMQRLTGVVRRHGACVTAQLFHTDLEGNEYQACRKRKGEINIEIERAYAYNVS